MSAACTPGRIFLALPVRLHRDQRGTMSIVSVFAVMLLVMILGMVMNVGRQVDGKIRLQNAADAIAYSGGVTLARGMNTLAFTNNLLCEIFAMTAFMEEAQARAAEQYVSKILAAWTEAGQTLSKAGQGNSIASKFSSIGNEIQVMVSRQQTLAEELGLWLYNSSTPTLDLLRPILQQEIIPQFQQQVIQAYPAIAQAAAQAVAQQNGGSDNGQDYGRGQMSYTLWKADGTPIPKTQDSGDPTQRCLPVLHPELDSMGPLYLDKSKWQRDSAAYSYLNLWNRYVFTAFGLGYQAQMCQFLNLWQGFTYKRLHDLLNDPQYGMEKNLVAMILDEGVDPYNQTPGFQGSACENRPYPFSPTEFSPFASTTMPTATASLTTAAGLATTAAPRNQLLNANFGVVGVAYWKHVPEFAATFHSQTLFDNPALGDSMAFAQVRFFLPRTHRVWKFIVPYSNNVAGTAYWGITGDAAPEKWSLMSENWLAQLVPTAGASLATILQQGNAPSGFTGPNLSKLSDQQIQLISPH